MLSPSRIISVFAVHLVLCALTVIPAAGQIPQWQGVTEGPGFTLFRHDDINFADAHLGYVVNQLGQIWKTEDSGVSWDLKYANGTRAFRAVAAIDDSVAFAGTLLTPHSVLYETTDGGSTWTDISDRITGDPPVAICGLWAVNDQLIFGVGAFYGTPRVIRTTDGGANWTSMSVSPAAETLIDIFFFDERVGIAIGGTTSTTVGNTVIIRTEDGGDTWNRVYESPRPPGVDASWGWKISFPTPEVGFVSVEFSNNPEDQEAVVLKTTDGGITWTELIVNGSVSNAGLQSVGFINERVGWASGRGVTSVTEDGGATWTQLQHYRPLQPEGQLDGAVNRILLVNDTLAVAVGEYVHRLVTSNVGTAVEAPPAQPESFDLLSAYPNPFRETTTLGLELRESAMVRVTVIDALGRRQGQLISEMLSPGRHEVVWNGRNAAGAPLPSGAYFLLIDVGNSQEMKQVVWIR